MKSFFRHDVPVNKNKPKKKIKIIRIKINEQIEETQ
jgi:hypothetical protein